MTHRVLIMTRKNVDPNKGIAFRYNLVAASKKLLNNSLHVTQMKIFKNHMVPTNLHGAAFGDKH